MSLKDAKTPAAVALAAAIAIATPLTAKWEARRNDPYLDIVGKPTVCFGETNVAMRHYSTPECNAMLAHDQGVYGQAMQACLPATVSKFTLAAFISFSYNVGTKAACGSTAAARVRTGDVKGGCDGLMAWNKVRKPLSTTYVVSRGLNNRRADERAVCMQGLVG